MKILRFIWDNILFIFTLFLLAFIPLYPKLPLIDIKNTWVYVRMEDFIVVFVFAVWALLLFKRKITLKTPLTLSIIIFWIVGGISTIHAVLLIFPKIMSVYPNVAFLSFLRRVEYLSLFFVAYTGIKTKRVLPYVIGVLTLTLLLVSLYGIGQKYLRFPAFLTMNEEFAKGTPIQLSSLSRVPSTFGGHYDLAAYLVLIIPILVSVIFGFRNWFVRIIILVTVFLGFIVLFMTVSRVSFFVLLLTLVGLLLFQKKKLIIYSLPVIAIIAILSLGFSKSLSQRFGNTVKEVDVLVNAKTGEEIGQVHDVEQSHFKDVIIKQRSYNTKSDLDAEKTYIDQDSRQASASAEFPLYKVPANAPLLVMSNTPTGENLPQGSAYVNLPLSPVVRKMGDFFFDKPATPGASMSVESIVFHGEFLIKRASAYDLSFTIRFQGEWPHAIDAFKTNILLGSGYSSISLAVDNDYLRLLGETGLLGFVSFVAIFLTAGIYIWKILPEVDSPVVKSFVLGFSAGVIGLLLNAVLIDVFEASKVAYVFWLLTGITLGTLHTYQKKYLDLFSDLKNLVTSNIAIILYLLIFTIAIFWSLVGNYFVGDDYTWFRWVADCGGGTSFLQHCPLTIKSIFNYFAHSDGFFYRPGTKTYFLLMYSAFWLNQAAYHIVSIFLHFIVSVLVFLLAKKILRDNKLSVLASFLFLIMSGYSEAVFWISSTGFLFTAVFALSSLLFYIVWVEKKKSIFFYLSIAFLICGFLFHELGVVTSLLIILYKFTTDESFKFNMLLTKIHYKILLIPTLFYLVIRYLSGSLWFSGDYSYNILKLPFNVFGNSIGYLFLAVFGSISLPFYEALRNFSKGHILLALVLFSGLFCASFVGYKFVFRKMETEDRKIVIFSFSFFVISLLPFLGLGNITSRYSYLSSIGFILFFVFLIKKLYVNLLHNGREISLACVIAIITIFGLLQIMQIQQIHDDWRGAGDRTKNFFIAIDELYSDYWAKEPMKFYFVNVPIRVGQAWIFPVGLSDALWFSFRNPNIRVFQLKSTKEALNLVTNPKNEKVFVFEESGSVLEKKKILQTR